MKWIVETRYVRSVEAPTKNEAEDIAMKDLCNQEGLKGEWIWNEFTEVVDKNTIDSL